MTDFKWTSFLQRGHLVTQNRYMSMTDIAQKFSRMSALGRLPGDLTSSSGTWPISFLFAFTAYYQHRTPFTKQNLLLWTSRSHLERNLSISWSWFA